MLPDQTELYEAEVEIIELLQSQVDISEKERLRLCRLARRTFALWRAALIEKEFLNEQLQQNHSSRKPHAGTRNKGAR